MVLIIPPVIGRLHAQIDLERTWGMEHTTDKNDWKNGPLNKALIAALPAFVSTTETPGITPSKSLNVQKLCAALEKSHEAIYKWLRQGKLTPRNAVQLINLANTPENVKLLKAEGRKPLKLEEFNSFVFG
jgi:hypothetical protein